MSKFVLIAKKMLKNLNYLEICDLNELRDAIFEAVDKIKKLNFDHTFTGSKLISEIEEISDEIILTLNRMRLIILFDKIRDCVHTRGAILDKIYPGTEQIWQDLAYWSD